MDIVLAYIDPGSGSLVIQALIAALVAAPFVFRQQLSRLVRKVKGDPGVSDTAAPASTTSDSDSAG